MTMPANASSIASHDNAKEGMPSETVRTIVTLVLFFHLFIALVAALGTLRSSSSELVRRLNVRLVGQLAYPDALLLSRFGYHLTYNHIDDYEGSAEIVLDWEAADESQPSRIDAKEKLVLFDPAEITLPIRQQRYLSMIDRMTEVVAAEDAADFAVEMPIEVSRVLLAAAGNPQGTHRFRLLRIPTPAPSYSDEQSPPTISAAYQGNIVLRGEDLEFTKADRAALSSPIVPGRGTNPPATNQNAPPSGNLLNPDGSPATVVPPLIPQTLLPPSDNPARTDGNR